MIFIFSCPFCLLRLRCVVYHKMACCVNSPFSSLLFGAFRPCFTGVKRTFRLLCKCASAKIFLHYFLHCARSARQECNVSRYPPSIRGGGILHSILHSSSAVPCAPALCTLHSRTCADFALGRAVGFRAGAVRRLGAWWAGVRVRPSLRVRPCHRRLSRRPQKSARHSAFLPLLALVGASSLVLTSVRPPARVDQGRDIVRNL